MKEVIIFSNINQFALLRQLAKYGVNTMGYRVFNNSSILSYIREKTGNLSSKKTINNKNKAYLYSNFLMNDTSYFKGSTYEAAKNLSNTIDSIRVLITDDEEKEFKDKLTNNKVFKEKYEAIYNLYKKYKEYLNTNEETDNIQETRDIIDSKLKIDLEVLTIKGEDISPLEKKLLDTCFKSVKDIEFRELFNVKENKVDLTNLFKSKGYTHEISNVFKIIADNHLAIDTCTIVYTDYKNFYNSIKEYSNLLSLPVTYTDGVPSTEYNAYRMLYLITKLNDGLYGYDVLSNLLTDKSFNFDKLMQDVSITAKQDDFIKEVGDLKFNFNSEYNDEVYANYAATNTDHLVEIKKFKDIFNKGIANLLKEYVVIDDASITNRLVSDIELYKSINNIDDFDYFKSLLTQLINPSQAKEGTITACSINKVKENVRENMFFVGNDSNSFHISLAENSYIADDKLEEFSKDYAKTSIKIANNKMEAYKEAIKLAFDLNSNVYVSYSEKDETALEKHNLISILYDLQKEIENSLTFEEFKGKFDPVNTYYGNSFNKEEKIIENYLDKTKIIVGDGIKEEPNDNLKDLSSRKYSPTAIEVNVKCKKRFLIERILKISSENDYDVFAKFNNTDLGNMFHEVMEFVNQGHPEKDVLKKAEEVFEAVRAKRNPLLKYELEKDKKEFMKMVHNGYEYLQKKPQGIAETDMDMPLNIKGNTLNVIGKPDLVAGNEIIDYKAKRSVTHKDEDPVSCIQALIYALMNSDKNIDHVEYYYPIFKKVVKTTNNEANTVALLDEFYQSISKGEYPAAIEKYDVKKDKDKLDDICKYCSFEDICGKKTYESD